MAVATGKGWRVVDYYHWKDYAGSEETDLIITTDTIAENAYANNTDLKSITVTSSVTSIGDGAFSGCDNLEYLDLSEANVPGLTADALTGLNESTVVVLPTVMPVSDAQTLSATASNIVYKDGEDYKSENVKLTDGEAFIAPSSINTITVKTITYNRPFEGNSQVRLRSGATTEMNNTVYSICLPYDQPIPDGIRAYKLREFNNENALVFEEVLTIDALTPYLLTATESVSQMSAENVVMHIYDKGGYIETTDYTLCGTLKPVSYKEASARDYLILQSDRQWLPADTEGILAYHAYLMPKSSDARTILSTILIGREDVNSIKTIDYDGTENYYDLQGHPIGNPSKAGIYIKDRKIVIIK